MAPKLISPNISPNIALSTSMILTKIYIKLPRYNLLYVYLIFPPLSIKDHKYSELYDFSHCMIPIYLGCIWIRVMITKEWEWTQVFMITPIWICIGMEIKSGPLELKGNFHYPQIRG